MRIYKADPQRLIDAILIYNLGFCSASVELIKDYEILPVSGFLAKEKGEIFGWIAEFENGEGQLFVRKEYRRRGIGTKLINKMKKKALVFCPWEEISSNFFAKTKVKITEKYI